MASALIHAAIQSDMAGEAPVLLQSGQNQRRRYDPVPVRHCRTVENVARAGAILFPHRLFDVDEFIITHSATTHLELLEATYALAEADV